mmetsp:Transcript_73808/g.240416  ORF Transcript_73808/g.240416 Transcript_73808/m.240416 type:complete len:244 (-) Transcript_73808:667-1398(-)
MQRRFRQRGRKLCGHNNLDADDRRGAAEAAHRGPAVAGRLQLLRPGRRKAALARAQPNRGLQRVRTLGAHEEPGPGAGVRAQGVRPPVAEVRTDVVEGCPVSPEGIHRRAPVVAHAEPAQLAGEAEEPSAAAPRQLGRVHLFEVPARGVRGRHDGEAQPRTHLDGVDVMRVATRRLAPEVFGRWLRLEGQRPSGDHENDTRAGLDRPDGRLKRQPHRFVHLHAKLAKASTQPIRRAPPSVGRL